MDFLNIVVSVCLLGYVHSYDKEILDLYMHKVTGQAVYAGKSLEGACQLGPVLPPAAVSHHIRYFVGVGTKWYGGSRSCGMCLKVRATGDGLGPDALQGEFLVMVNDVCSTCEHGRLDLGADGNGRWGIEMQAAQCPVGNSMIEYKMHGSGEWFLRIQIRNARIPVQAVHVVRNGAEESMTMSSDGFWELGNGHFSLPVYIKMIGVTDEPIYDVITKIENGVIIQGAKGAQFTLDPNLPK